MIWHLRDKKIDLAIPKVMAIVNVTPDSFSDGGKYYHPEEAIRRARNAIVEGASIIDFGAESTAPDATALSWREEWSRLEGIFKLLDAEPLSVPISIDTYHPETAEQVLKHSVAVINCVKLESALEIASLSRKYNCGVILPAKANNAIAISNAEQTLVDPLIGFNTSREEDLTLLRSIPELAKSHAVCVGVSRKRLVKKLTGEKNLGKNLGGNLGLAVWCVLNGASLVRVHDVRETVQAINAAFIVNHLEAKI